MPINEAIVKRALDAVRALSEPGRTEQQEPEPMTPKVTPAPGPTPATTHDELERQFIQRFDAEVESRTIGGVELPTRRCRACGGYLFWVAIHGAVVCAGCHPPAKRSLIEQWYWLPEGERKTLQ